MRRRPRVRRGRPDVERARPRRVRREVDREVDAATNPVRNERRLDQRPFPRRPRREFPDEHECGAGGGREESDRRTLHPDEDTDPAAASTSLNAAATTLNVERGRTSPTGGTMKPRLRRTSLVAAAGALLALFVAVGALGAYRYGYAYWLYRGFPPPRDPAFVTKTGTAQEISVTSPALGGRSQPVEVYLPPGYSDSPARRYPVVYLLHGFPGRPLAFLLTVRAGVVEDELVATGAAQPAILVMPFGSTGTFTDKEWANGVRPNEGWETFVARDLVQAIAATLPP